MREPFQVQIEKPIVTVSHTLCYLGGLKKLWVTSDLGSMDEVQDDQLPNIDGKTVFTLHMEAYNSLYPTRVHISHLSNSVRTLYWIFKTYSGLCSKESTEGSFL